MSPSFFLSLLGLLLCTTLALGNPISRTEEMTGSAEPSDDAEERMQPLDDIIANDYIINQHHNIEETSPDLGESTTNASEDHNENLDRILGDSEDLDKEEVVEENASEDDHGVVKRDVEDEDAEDDTEVVEEGEHEGEEGSEDEEEHDVVKRDVNEELLKWYRESIDSTST